MIVAERKPLNEIMDNLQGISSVAVAGCATCVTVCSAGGEKEVAVLSSLLRIAAEQRDQQLNVTELMVERQCEWEFLDEIIKDVSQVEAVVSLGCGAGVQAMASYFEDDLILPGLNTRFIGMPEQQGLWVEMCMACGDCMLDKTGGICPVARCAKSCFNGPCGGSQDGSCEIDPDTDCAWQLIFDKLQKLDRLQILQEIEPVKDWSSSRHGGPRRIEREDLIL